MLLITFVIMNAFSQSEKTPSFEEILLNCLNNSKSYQAKVKATESTYASFINYSKKDAFQLQAGTGMSKYLLNASENKNVLEGSPSATITLPNLYNTSVAINVPFSVSSLTNPEIKMYPDFSLNTVISEILFGDGFDSVLADRILSYAGALESQRLKELELAKSVLSAMQNIIVNNNLLSEAEANYTSAEKDLNEAVILKLYASDNSKLKELQYAVELQKIKKENAKNTYNLSIRTFETLTKTTWNKDIILPVVNPLDEYSKINAENTVSIQLANKKYSNTKSKLSLKVNGDTPLINAGIYATSEAPTSISDTVGKIDAGISSSFSFNEVSASIKAGYQEKISSPYISFSLSLKPDLKTEDEAEIESLELAVQSEEINRDSVILQVRDELDALYEKILANSSEIVRAKAYEVICNKKYEESKMLTEKGLQDKSDEEKVLLSYEKAKVDSIKAEIDKIKLSYELKAYYTQGEK